MTETWAITIYFEVHKTIEIARWGFSETQNEVLRRLLGIDTAKGARSGSKPKPATGIPWGGKGVS